MDTNERSDNILHFSYIDYAIFIILLILSSAIGIYYGFLSKTKQNNANEYLLGGKKMALFPISVSLIVSHISGITMLVFPTEVYAYGTQFWISFISALAIVPSVLYIFYPVFSDLKLLSTFMYFEKRYHRIVRLVASAVFIFSATIFLPVIVYIPGIAFNQVSGVNVYAVTTTICVICVFYTSLGGLRAVVWTDMVQFVLMFGAIISVIVLGVLSLKNPWTILKDADDGERLVFFDMNPSPFVRTSFWTYTIGLTTLWSSIFSSSQSFIQKLLALPDAKTARKATWIFVIGKILFHSCAIVTGLVMYSSFKDCDPYTAGAVSKIDQVLPYYVMKIGSKIPGLAGLFIAGIVSGALSSISGLLNTISCVMYEDFLADSLKNSTDKTRSIVLKLIVALFGIIVTMLVFVVEKLGPIFQMTITISAVPSGALLGLFTTGMLCRKINAKGAIVGAVLSIFVVGSLVIGSQTLSKPQILPMRTDGCDASINPYTNATLLNEIRSQNVDPLTSPDEDVFLLFRISFMYYALIGCLVVWIVSYPISLLTSSEPLEDENLLAPFMRRKNKTLQK